MFNSASSADAFNPYAPLIHEINKVFENFAKEIEALQQRVATLEAEIKELKK